MSRVEQIEARLAAATRGPWREGTLNVWQDELLRCVAKTERGRYVDGTFRPAELSDSHDQMQWDAELIAHAPADLAWLLAENKRLRGALQLLLETADDGAREAVRRKRSVNEPDTRYWQGRADEARVLADVARAEMELEADHV